MTLAAAIDLGTTRIKAGLLDRNRRMTAVVAAEAPPLAVDGLRAESSAEAYADVVERLLSSLPSKARQPLPLGIASQRSSFVLWGDDGRPWTPLISWRDRRAADWCERHGGSAEEVHRRTGLLLSPHYAGPKLAVVLGALSGRGTAKPRFGTLDSYVVWRLGGAASHETDLTMAARTLMADPEAGDWADGQLRWFDAHDRVRLPTILPTRAPSIEIGGRFRLAARVADQPSALLARVGDRKDALLVNLGTGGFVLRPTGGRMRRLAGFLSGPILGADDGRHRYALEGTINGAGATIDRFGRGPTELPREDPTPDAFCMPDSAGYGAPHWRPRGELAWSEGARRLAVSDRRRVALEGVFFRVREIVEALDPDGEAALLLSGGLSRDAAVPAGLAATLGRPVRVLGQSEATLLGAALLAAGQPLDRGGVASACEPGAAGAFLASKYTRWREWLRGTVLPASG